MARVKAGGDLPPIYTWNEPGQKLEGTWLGRREAKYGPLGQLDTPDGPVTFAMPTVLRSRLWFSEGTYLWIEYTGEVPSKGGPNPMKEFVVEFDDTTGKELPPEKENNDKARF